MTRFAWLSIAAALATLGLKGTAWYLTGSVGLLSDALESLVNLAAAGVALVVLGVACQPPDEEHAYGHEKVEYFSGGLEGALIVMAALSIAVAAVDRLLHPRPLEHLGTGLAVAGAAALLNGGVAGAIGRASRRLRSPALEANARHLMTDVWTSVGVLAAVGAVKVTGWQLLDPLIALAVAGNIVRSGAGLLRRAVMGLMDAALPEKDQAVIREVLDRYSGDGVRYHALRTRRSGRRSFVSVHILVPGEWSVRRGHTLLERLERDIRRELPGATVFTHLEPVEDPVSWADTRLDR